VVVGSGSVVVVGSGSVVVVGSGSVVVVGSGSVVVVVQSTVVVVVVVGGGSEGWQATVTTIAAARANAHPCIRLPVIPHPALVRSGQSRKRVGPAHLGQPSAG
jgi:hypothetical protein